MTVGIVGPVEGALVDGIFVGLEVTVVVDPIADLFCIRVDVWVIIVAVRRVVRVALGQDAAGGDATLRYSEAVAILVRVSDEVVLLWAVGLHAGGHRVLFAGH